MTTREQEEGGNNNEKPFDLLSSVVVVPKLLKKSAGGEICCIFRIPKRLVKNNDKAYEPRVVSIGPYHHENKNLVMIQEHKHRLLGVFMEEAQEKGVDPKDLYEAVSKLEDDIRESYSESLYDNDASGGKKLIDMMVLDGCFILMVFMVVAGLVRYRGLNDDPIFRVPWILPAIRSDLLLLENQVPFFLLKTLFKKSKIGTSSGLNAITFKFFSLAIEKPDAFWSERETLKAKHLLDLIRKIFIPIRKKKAEEEETDLPRPFLSLVLSAKKLQLRGIEFKPRKNAETLLEIKLEKNRVEIPQLNLDDFMISIFLNCVAFEQFYAETSTKHMTSYVAFMGCLLNNEDDALLLNEEGIIENYFGSLVEVAQIFKVIGKDIVFHISESYLADVFEGVNKYTSKGFHVWRAEFIHTHFDTPWTFVSSCAALILIILTVFQAVMAGVAYFHPPKSS